MKKLFLCAIIFYEVHTNASWLADLASWSVKKPSSTNPTFKSKVPEFYFSTFHDWAQACHTLPLFKDGGNFKEHSAFQKVAKTKQKQFEELSKVLDAWFYMKVLPDLNQQTSWSMCNLGIQQPTFEFFNSVMLPEKFQPFAQKLLLKPNDQCIIRGDLHGDIHSLIAQLQDLKTKGILSDDFKIIPDNVWMLFLGDYVDRGQYGAEVIYTLLRLSLANPDRVILVRGNHEDYSMSRMFDSYLAYEIANKFGDGSLNKTDSCLKKICRMYDFLPVVLYVGCQDPEEAEKRKVAYYINWVQCCHGGIELGYDPLLFLNDHNTKFQLLGWLHRESFLNRLEFACDQDLQNKSGKPSNESKELKEALTRFKTIETRRDWSRCVYRDQTYLVNIVPGILDFLWGDFEVSEKNVFEQEQFSKRLNLGKFATEMILALKSDKKNRLVEVIRAHQHNNISIPILLASNGVAKWWHLPEKDFERPVDDALVITFNVAPDSGYGFQFAESGLALPTFDYDTYAALTVQSRLADWKIAVVNKQIYPAVFR